VHAAVSPSRRRLPIRYAFSVSKPQIARTAMLAFVLACAPVLPVHAADVDKPVLSLVTLAGEEIDLGRLRGHVVVLHFWATWCEPCLTEMPELEKFYARYRKRGVEVIALSQDRARDMDRVHEMMHRMRMTYPVAMAHNASHNSLGEQAALPVTYVIDVSGAVRERMRPDAQPVTAESLARIVEPLLPPDAAATAAAP
jgi:peroxiredoxin